MDAYFIDASRRAVGGNGPGQIHDSVFVLIKTIDLVVQTNAVEAFYQLIRRKFAQIKVVGFLIPGSKPALQRAIVIVFLMKHCIDIERPYFGNVLPFSRFMVRRIRVEDAKPYDFIAINHRSQLNKLANSGGAVLTIYMVTLIKVRKEAQASIKLRSS